MPQPAPCSFNEAFERVLLDRTGVKMTRGKFVKEHMDKELQLARKVEGFAVEGGTKDEQIGGTSIVEGAQKAWSADSEELMGLVRPLGPRNPNLASEAFLKPFFRDLNLSGASICSIDANIVAFSRLTSLDISGSLLSQISALPPNLQILHAYSSSISRITCEKTPSLRFLGLGHSRMDERGLEQAAKRFKNLLSLDVSYSAVSELDKAADLMFAMRGLKQLCFEGSPVCLLPHYRMRTVALFPQLRSLDGLAVTEEEAADAKLRIAPAPPAPAAAEASPEGECSGDAAAAEGGGEGADGWEAAPSPGPTARLTVQPLKLTGLRALLQPLADELAVRKRALGPSPGSEPPEGGELDVQAALDAVDGVQEACAGGALRLKFELPDGTWVESAELPLDVEDPQPADGAALDALDLAGLKDASGGYLSFLVGIDQGDDSRPGGLRDLHRWLREGMQLKVFCRPPAPLSDEALREAMAAAAELASNPQGGAKDKGKKAAAAAPKKVAEAKGKKAPEAQQAAEEDAPPPELPPERPVGGLVVPLDPLLRPARAPAGAQARELGEVPSKPPPVHHEVSGARVVPMERLLDPEVQVPIGIVGDKKRAGACTAVTGGAPAGEARPASGGDTLVTTYGPVGAPGASLQIRVTLFAGDPAEELRAPTPAAEDPKAKKKSKK